MQECDKKARGDEIIREADDELNSIEPLCGKATAPALEPYTDLNLVVRLE